MPMVEIRRLTVLNALIQSILYMYTVCVHIDAMHGTCNIMLTHVPVITAGHLDSLYTELTENILRFAKVHGPHFANILLACNFFAHRFSKGCRTGGPYISMYYNSMLARQTA